MSCAVRVTPRNRVEKHCVRAAATVTIQPHTSAVIPIRFKELKTNQDYVFTPYPNNMYLPENTCTLKGIVKGDQDGIFITNVDDVPRTISKGSRVGQIGSLEGPPKH
jgi:dUTPase